MPAIAEFCFEPVDENYPSRARTAGGHMVTAGDNYGQGSSREHAALAPRYLGLRVVVARSFARIHRQNLINYGVLPLVLDKEANVEALKVGDVVGFQGIHRALDENLPVSARRRAVGVATGGAFSLRHDLSPRQREVVRAGGLVNWLGLGGRGGN